MSIASVSDDMIQECPPRESGVIDYRLGSRITVSYMRKDRWLCKTCSWPKNYQTADHEGCEHITRVARFREEHAV